MSRVSKTDVNRVLENTARALKDAGGTDGRVSRAEVKKALAGMQGTQKALADVFFRFVDHRDFKTGGQVTPDDLKRAVGYAKEKMVAKYDLNSNGLSASEVKKMSLTGRLAVDLAKALKAASFALPAAGLIAGEAISDLVLRRMKVESETTIKGSAAIASVDPTLAKQIIAACHESSYTDVRSVQDAINSVDLSEIWVRTLKDPSTGEKFVVVDYGAGGKLDGAIFAEGTTNPLARIHDSIVELK